MPEQNPAPPVQIQDVEAAERWDESIDRVIAAANALKVTVKSWKTQQRAQGKTFEGVCVLREALREALAEEGAKFARAVKLQGELPLQPPAEGERPKPKALPPRRLKSGSDGEVHP